MKATDIGEVLSNREEAARRLRTTMERCLGATALGELRRDGVKELMLNPDGTFWVEYLGGRGMVQMETSIAPSAAMMMMETMASMLGTPFTPDRPILEGEFPLDMSRFEGVCAPVVSGPTFAIRKKASRIITMEEYDQRGILTHLDDPSNRRKKNARAFHQRCKGLKHIEVIRLAIRLRLNILVVGGTGSGKTTFLNAIANEIALIRPTDRQLIIEDTGEIQCAAANKVILRSTEAAPMVSCLRAAMRLNPTSVSVGEARGPEVKVWIKACNTGHPGGFATLHADDGRKGLARVESLWEEDGTQANRTMIGDAVNLIVFIEEDATLDSGRKIKEVISVEGYDIERNQYNLFNV
ncbi:ATPase, T2SS/T4P/T4SS family [Herbaspirillum huttiense]|uniref:ATPase, T2SS/T4P/T4SS family n=1 Tax=Herbaspirillum huttiense TaxID=863372 RepID=UPI0037F3DCC0